MMPRTGHKKATTVALLAVVVACTSPGAPVTAEGSPASGELLGVSLHGVRIYAVRDQKRNVTCWIPVNAQGTAGGIHCEPDVAPPQPDKAARTDTSVIPTTGAVVVPVPALPPVPPAPATR